MEEQMKRLRKIKTSCRMIRGFLWVVMGFMIVFAVAFVWYGFKVAATPESAFTVTQNRFGGLSIDMAGQTCRWPPAFRTTPRPPESAASTPPRRCSL